MNRFRSTGHLVVAVLCLSILPAGAIAQQQNTTAAADANAPQQKPKVTLLEQGVAPRYKLRYAPKAGDVQYLRFTQEMSMTQSMGDMDMPAQVLPATSYTMKVTVRKVDDATGNISCAFECVDVEIEDTPGAAPIIVSQLRRTLDSFKKMTGTFIIDPRGFVLESHVELPDKLNPMVRQNIKSLEQSMGQLGTPLPAEEIGTGARWTVESTADFGGITCTQTYTMTASEVTERALATAVEVDQHADAQQYAPPGMPGMTMQLESLNGDGEGGAVYDMTSVVPESSSVDYEQTSTFTVPVQGQQRTLRQSMTMVMTIKRVPEPDSAKTAGATDDR